MIKGCTRIEYKGNNEKVDENSINSQQFFHTQVYYLEVKNSFFPIFQQLNTHYGSCKEGKSPGTETV